MEVEEVEVDVEVSFKGESLGEEARVSKESEVLWTSDS